MILFGIMRARSLVIFKKNNIYFFYNVQFLMKYIFIKTWCSIFIIKWILFYFLLKICEQKKNNCSKKLKKKDSINLYVCVDFFPLIRK